MALFGLLFAALLIEPWWTLAAICLIYLVLMPWAYLRYARVKRQRGVTAMATAGATGPDGEPGAP